MPMTQRPPDSPHPRLTGSPAAAPKKPSLIERLLRRPAPLDVLVAKTRACPLCDEALRILRDHARRLRLSIRVSDITDDGELMGTYGDRVPVVFLEGRLRFFGRVDPVLLRREARAIRRSRMGP